MREPHTMSPEAWERMKMDIYRARMDVLGRYYDNSFLRGTLPTSEIREVQKYRAMQHSSQA